MSEQNDGESRELTTGDGREMTEARPLAGPLFDGRQAMSAAANVGAIAIEQERAIAETQGKMILAKRFPRSMAAAAEEFKVACSDLAFAQTAFYTVPNRGSGPSIRFAEEVARCYGNFDYGHKELSRDPGDGTQENPGKSEVEVYAWDMEKNNYSRRQITVQHTVDTKSGPKILRDQTDIDNRIANVASKQMRGRILALVSKALVAAGVEACKLTLAGKGDKPIAAKIMDMTAYFAKLGVTVAHLEGYLKHKVEECTLDDLADLRGVITAINDGAKVSEYFGAEAESTDDPFVKAAEPEKKPAAPKKAEKAADAPPPEKAEAPAAAAAPAPQEAPQQPEPAATATTPAAEAAPAAPVAAEASTAPNAQDMF